MKHLAPLIPNKMWFIIFDEYILDVLYIIK